MVRFCTVNITNITFSLSYQDNNHWKKKKLFFINKDAFLFEKKNVNILLFQEVHSTYMYRLRERFL